MSKEVMVTKTTETIVLDGRLEESIWKDAKPARDFFISFPVDYQTVPDDLQTEVRLAYDDQFLYVGAICKGPNDYYITTLKRDSREFWSGDVFSVLIDPVNEAANGFNFSTNPAGVQYESLISGRTGTRAEMNSGGSISGFNAAWDNRWFVEIGQHVDHWVVEMAIPFKTLRFDPDKVIWGVNFIRGEPRSNSWHTWSPVPVQFLTVDLGYTGSLHWDQNPQKNKSNISVIPYGLGSTVKDFEEGTDSDTKFRTGVDAKVAVTSSLNLDLTINPDFSQVDVDEQVTNLTTFNIRFPERRLFFLENSDIFSDFGIPPMRPFFSRRIGLDEDGNTIPIEFGARLSGNLNNDLRIGLMNLQTRQNEEFSGQNYTSIALQQRVLDRSVVKGYFHNRQMVGTSEANISDFNRVAGLEFSYFSRDAKWRGFGGYGFSLTEGYSGDNFFYNIGGGYDGRNFSIYSNLSGIGNNYYADMGWLPSADHYDAVRDTSIHIGFQHLFSRISYTFYPADQSKVNARQIGARHIFDMTNSGQMFQNNISVSYVTNYSSTASLSFQLFHQDNRLLFPFDFTDEEPLPPGLYHSNYASAEYESDSRRFFTYQLGFQIGSFYGGSRLGTSLRCWLSGTTMGKFSNEFCLQQIEI